jgi:hypothetical protein
VEFEHVYCKNIKLADGMSVALLRCHDMPESGSDGLEVKVSASQPRDNEFEP